MNKYQYDQGYNHGASATQDQAAGAAAWRRDQERANRENQARWDRLNAQEDEERRRRQKREKDARRRESAAADKQRRQAVKKGPSRGASTGARATGSGPQGFIGFLGFLGGAYLGFLGFGENLIAIGICAIVLAIVAAAFYRVIIGLAIVGGVAWLLVSQAADAATPAAHERAATFHDVENAKRDDGCRADPAQSPNERAYR